MVYIFNKYIPPRKTIQSALTRTYGIGFGRAAQVAGALCTNPNKRFYELTPTQISRLSKFMVAQCKVGSALQREINENVRSLIKIRSYRGSRHKNRLPVRGQRTHTNARTQKKMVRV